MKLIKNDNDMEVGEFRRYFSDVEDFNNFMVSEKPKEIWLDEFMEDEPYIILSLNDGVKFSGVYNHQCLLGGDNSDFRWLFKSGMYVKNEMKTGESKLKARQDKLDAHNPDELEPVLAQIEHTNDLGKSKWYEVVYFDGNWRSYAASATFDDGEKVIKWKYCKDCL